MPIIFFIASGCNSQPKQLPDSETKNAQQQANDFDLSTKCAKQAQDFFEYFVPNLQDRQKDEFSNHYNKKLSKCFVLVKQYISNNVSGKFSSGTSKDLYDAIEKKVYGSYSWMSDSPKKYWEVPPLWCEMYADGNQGNLQACKTEGEFDAFTFTYMNE